MKGSLLSDVNEEADYEQMYDVLLSCGKNHNVYNLCGSIAREMSRVVSYDQARVIFLDVKGKISSSMLYGVRQQAWNTFLDYYSDDCIGSLYSLKEPLHLSANQKVHLCDWTDEETVTHHEQFASEYVHPLSLKYCLGMGLSDGENCIRSIISFDRTGDKRYTDREIEKVRLIHPLLENLHINLFVHEMEDFSQREFLCTQYELTSREKEIAALLCRGARASAIATRLGISVNTAYKHIANMYQKMHVNNRQELIYMMTEKS